MSAKFPRGGSKHILSHLSTMPFVMDKLKMALLLLINCLCTPYCLCVWCSVFVFVLVCITLCPFSCSNHLEEEDYVFIVSPMSCHFIFSVALPRDAMDWSAVCDSGISLSYSITFSLHQYLTHQDKFHIMYLKRNLTLSH